MSAIGHTRWALAECQIPSGAHRLRPPRKSHESVCLLNTSDNPANVRITVYFAEREPAGPYNVQVPPRRAMHVDYSDLKDPEELPRNTEFASIIESDVPIIVQHTRLDARQADDAILTTMALPG